MFWIKIVSNLVAIDLFKVVTSGRSFGTNLALLRKRVRIEETNLVVMVFKLALIFGSLLPVGTASLFLWSLYQVHAKNCPLEDGLRAMLLVDGLDEIAIIGFISAESLNILILFLFFFSLFTYICFRIVTFYFWRSLRKCASEQIPTRWMGGSLYCAALVSSFPWDMGFGRD